MQHLCAVMVVINKTITLHPRHQEFLENSPFNLSEFVRTKLNELMDKLDSEEKP